MEEVNNQLHIHKEKLNNYITKLKNTTDINEMNIINNQIKS